MRRTVPALSLLGTLVFLPACGSTPGTAAEAPSADEGSDTRVFHLRFADAAATKEILEDLLEPFDGTVEVTPMPRQNALVVSGDAAFRRRIAKLIERLDRPDYDEFD